MKKCSMYKFKCNKCDYSIIGSHFHENILCPYCDRGYLHQIMED